MDNKEFPLVSVIVLNYNGKKFLDGCFNTVLASTYPNFEVIMVDNKSTEDDVDYVEERFPEVKIFQNGVNGGFSLAYNNSFKIAKGKYFVLLNNDVTVKADWIEPIVEEFEKDDKIGAIQPKLLSMLDKSKFEYAGAGGGFLDIYGFPFLKGRVFNELEEDKGQYDYISEIFWASGAAMFVRADILPETGGLDVDFVHHMEEIDLCYRIRLMGYKIKVVPKSEIYHFGGATIAPNSFKKIYWNHRNSVFMMYKNLETKNLFKIMFIRHLLDIIAISWALTRFDFRHIWAISKGHWWLLFNLRLMNKKRREVQKKRLITDKEIFQIMYPKSVALQHFLHKKRTYKELMKGVENNSIQ